VRWTEQVRLQHFISLLDIRDIGFAQMSNTAYMMIGMVTQTMSVPLYHFEHFRIFPHIVAHHKEGGFDLVLP
jgi:hypothetical protein